MRVIPVLCAAAALLGAQPALPLSAGDDGGDRFVAALLSTGPHQSIPADRDIYRPLLGSWQFEGTSYRGGMQSNVVGRIEMARVLDGRAVQDVWTFRLDAARPFDAANRRVGTTLRIYDPVEDVWKATWLDPATRNQTQLVARRDGRDIVHVGTNAAGVPMRWTFTDITGTSFLWKGEHSEDGGRTWQLNAEYRARRVAAPRP